MYDRPTAHLADRLDPASDSAGEAAGDVGLDTATDFRLETDLQVQEATDALRGMQGLDPGQWEALDSTGRLEALQQVEERMAAIQGRPSVDVLPAAMDDGTFGGYVFDERRIYVNAAHLDSSELPVAEFVDTVVHEGRHAYQHYATEHPGFVTDAAQVEAWGDNRDNYLSAEQYGQELYQSQPVEADAWDYADRITSRLYGGRTE